VENENKGKLFTPTCIEETVIEDDHSGPPHSHHRSCIQIAQPARSMQIHLLPLVYLLSHPQRQGLAYILVRQATSLLQRTKLNVTVSCQAWHAKNARHMLLDIVDYNEPTMLIVGSRGLGQLRGYVRLLAARANADTIYVVSCWGLHPTISSKCVSAYD